MHRFRSPALVISAAGVSIAGQATVHALIFLKREYYDLG
jgi:hypothetical protein